MPKPMNLYGVQRKLIACDDNLTAILNSLENIEDEVSPGFREDILRLKAEIAEKSYEVSNIITENK